MRNTKVLIDWIQNKEQHLLIINVVDWVPGVMAQCIKYTKMNKTVEEMNSSQLMMSKTYLSDKMM